MIYIKKGLVGKQFFISVTGKNGEKLSVTETFKSKQSAWKNVFAQADNFKSEKDFEVCDETGKIFFYYKVACVKGKYVKEKCFF